MTDTATDLLELLYNLAYGTRRRLNGDMTKADSSKHKQAYMRRGLCCTPYGGNYGMVAGWVVCVVGSPPKGTITMPVSNESNPRVEGAYYFFGSSKNLYANSKHLAILQAFVDEHLAGRNEACNIGSELMHV